MDIKWTRTRMVKQSSVQNDDCIIVIPVYKNALKADEKISLFQCIKLLGDDFEICLAYPKGLNISYYTEISNGFKFNLLECNPEYFKGTDTYSCLCETADFYYAFLGYRYMLIYQLDGWVLKNDLYQFINMNYDYIGSPWPAGSYGFARPSVGNGGVSLRNIDKFIELCNNLNIYDRESKYAKSEDIFFCKYVKSVKKQVQFCIADVKDAMKFGFTTSPVNFYHDNDDQLPMFAHGWNAGYEFEFWKDYIPLEKFEKLNNFDYNSFYEKMKKESLKIKEANIQEFKMDIYEWGSTESAGIYDYGFTMTPATPQPAAVQKQEEAEVTVSTAVETPAAGLYTYDNIQMSDAKTATAKTAETDNFDDVIVDLSEHHRIDENQMVIVTFTTWKKRINNISYIIDDILKGTMIPDKICINLSVEDFPNMTNDFPQRLVDRLNAYGDIIEINWLSHNTKVWKKLIPTLCKYQDAIVISIDDDWKYPNDIVETLYKDFCKYDKKYPISGNRVRLYGMNCHCGSGSLTTYDLLNREGQFDTLSEECMKYGSDDIFYSYCAKVNGNEYKQSSKMFFTNMTPFQSNDGFSGNNSEKVNIRKTYDIAKDNYEQKIESKQIKYICQNFNSDILICIFNYKHDENAKKWLHMLRPYFETYVLDSGNDHIEKEFIQYPNIYYSGLFNEMKKLSEKKYYKWVGMIPSDITLISEQNMLIDKINWLCSTFNIGLWQPSLDKNSRKFGDNIHNDKQTYEAKKVLEAHFLFIKHDILHIFNYIDLNINSLGYGISEILSGISMKLKFGNIFDNSIIIHHANHAEYDTNKATDESNVWTPIQCKRYGLDLPYLINIVNNNTIEKFNISFEYIPKIIVSMTSWKKRIPCVPEAIKSIKQQTLQPDKIILTLSSDELTINDIPKEIIDDPFIELNWVAKNVKSWKKFLPIKDHFNDYVVLCDDDFYYHSTYIEELYNCAKQHDSTGVVCYSCNYCTPKGLPWGNEKGFVNTGKYWIAGGATMWCPQNFPMESFDMYNDIMSIYDLQCDECYLMPFVYYHKIPIHIIEKNWKTFFKKTKEISNSQKEALHRKFFNGNSLENNGKNILLQKVVSSLPEVYRNAFKNEFNQIELISNLFPENKK